MNKPCRLCNSKSIEPMIDFGARPIAHRLLEDPDEQENTYPMELHLCLDCGLIQVLNPIDPEILYTDFNYNFSAWKPEPHLEDEINMILTEGPFSNVVEFGCNDGTFLKNLKDSGIATCVGIEPNPVSGGMAKDKGLQVYQSWVNTDICNEIIKNHGLFDLVVSRQVIEHIPDLENFLLCIKKLLKTDGVLFLDMPDFEPSLLAGDCSAVWEEHVSYFTEPVLENLLARHGLKISEVRKYDFSSGCLAVIARPKDGLIASKNTEIARIINLANSYKAIVHEFEQKLRDKLCNVRKEGAEVVLYGVGVRGCCTLNGLTLSDLVDYAVDDQPERQGKFMPGCRLAIRPSSVLNSGKNPIVCLLAVNNENEDKVEIKVRKDTSRSLTFITLCSPKNLINNLAKLSSIREQGS